MTTTVAIVDDNKHVVQHLVKLLEHEPSIKMIYATFSAKEMFSYLEKSELPDVILMDVNMPEVNGIVATKIIKQHYPNIKILMLTTFDEDEYIFESIINGASGYLLKEDTNEQLVNSIEVLKNGGAPMSPSIAYKTLDLLRKSQESSTAGQNEFNLTKREIEIIQLIANGEDYNKIAEQLFISPKTVRNHIQNIYEKLQVHNKAEAVIKALRNDIIK